jgi:hypothetical protein
MASAQRSQGSGFGVRRCTGFTYLFALFALAIASAMAARGSVVWHTESVREREQELIRIGEEFRGAIGTYYERSPGAVKRYPEKLDDLLRDDRYLSLQRYLRRIYRDPFTGKAEWGLVQAPTGGIMGVYSLSTGKPMKTADPHETGVKFSNARHYSDWKFTYVPVAPVLSMPATDRKESTPPAPGAREPIRTQDVIRP